MILYKYFSQSVDSTGLLMILIKRFYHLFGYLGYPLTFSEKGKPLPTPPSGRYWTTLYTAKIGKGTNQSGDKDSPPTTCQRPSRKGDERVEVRETTFPQDGKLSVKADEPQVAYGLKMWKGNGNNTTLFFPLKGLEILHQGRRGQVKVQ